ncbi:M20/M25/M40 family metallo-hydrolase, partial [Arthrospira platensis SPKY1]|nr:M20/M25/M40 family metallo-hydrolase [Arthrospira platensis SPKY1]
DAVVDSDDAVGIGDDAVAMLRELLRIDTSNHGDDSGPGEIEAARWAVAKLAEVGIEAELFSTTATHRAGVSAFLPGVQSDREPLLLTGHLDVVPADPAGWTHPPFSGHLDDEGVVWGRGA